MKRSRMHSSRYALQEESDPMDQKPISMREAIGNALIEMGSTNKDLMVVGADTTESLHLMPFGEKYPGRLVNIGIAEQNMIGISSGLALSGKTVFCGTYMVFIERALDQIRNTLAYCKLNVKIIGAHTGISVGPDGGSHQTIEDIAMMRALANMRVLVPSDAYTARRLAIEAANEKGPFYIRLIRGTVPDVHGDQEIKIGKSSTLKDGKDVSIIACGIMVHEALKAAEMLSKEGISARVIDCYSIKPIDEETVLKAANETKGIVTAEDHNIYGGLGSAVAELLSRKRPTRIEMVAVNDTFGESGNPSELMIKYGISAQNIFDKAKELVK